MQSEFDMGPLMRNTITACLMVFTTICSQATWAQVVPQIGDQWIFELSNERRGTFTTSEVTRKVVAFESDFYVFEVITRHADTVTSVRETRDSNLNIVESGNIRYKPSLDLFRLPLVVGKRSYAIERLQIDSGRVVKMAGEVQVFPPTKMVTAAGEFEVTEVMAKGRYIDPKTDQSSRYQTRAWFAPTIGFFVKQEFFERNIEDTKDTIRLKLEIKSFKLQLR
ncbi:MAG: hypothetical protein COW02_00310 [Comamonadaceae bacterium CG12_big_fil_rev_8_21_14_0_65_59_15]|nr:MAG: hypothetical protein COW02_00310 [Comamonadaceae bacterium CG12_big_fil_rev_8_21_14_0_65_59_15]